MVVVYAGEQAVIIFCKRFHISRARSCKGREICWRTIGRMGNWDPSLAGFPHSHKEIRWSIHHLILFYFSGQMPLVFHPLLWAPLFFLFLHLMVCSKFGDICIEFQKGTGSHY